MSDEEKTKRAQTVYDAVMKGFPGLRQAMLDAQAKARKVGYTETILGRRRHLPDMQLPEFEFVAMPGYVNPDIDPLDPDTLKNKSDIPERIVKQLKEEFKGYKYFGQIAKRTRELYEQKIRVINNRPAINDATRQTLNGIIQGSAADLTKMAILALETNDEWHRLGGRLLVPVHDELICECPYMNRDRCAEILSQMMCDAGDFLPFPISCDVEITNRWYGLSDECDYEKPTSLDNLSKENIKWIQYNLLEMEYILPVFKDEDGNKPRGDAARGLNGVDTPEMRKAIQDYVNRYRITEDQFIEHIGRKVSTGA